MNEPTKQLISGISDILLSLGLVMLAIAVVLWVPL